MKRINNQRAIGLLTVLFMMVTFIARADVFDDIAVGIRAGNASDVAKYFDSSVELKTGEKSTVYSRNQAELVLREFFGSHQPKTFTLIHRGSSAKGARYAIGSYETTSAETFRVYLYIKEISGKLFIQEISFEKE